MKNLYDNLEIDIAKKHCEINVDPNFMSHLKHTRGIFLCVWDKLSFRCGLHKRLIDSGFKRDWFEEFYEYWVSVLGGRPLLFHDFFFLYSWYRVKYQEVGIENENSQVSLIKAYQDPKNIYMIFSLIYKMAISPFAYFLLRKYIKSGDKILEYGAGTAPVITSLIKDNKINFDFTAADIPQFTFHYAKWRLKQFGVQFIDVDLARLPILPKQYDVIILQAVLEHLPNPLEVVKHLTNYLSPSGYLIFDYIISDGKGFDTKASLQERNEVLKYIKENYILKLGKITEEESMGRTVVKKNK